MKAYNRVACIQMTSSDDVSENLLNTHHLIQQAMEQGAQLMCLPEMVCRHGIGLLRKKSNIKKFWQRSHSRFFTNQAKEYGVWIVGGTIPIAVPTVDTGFCDVFRFNDQGECVAFMTKYIC